MIKVKVYGMNKNSGGSSDRKRIAEEYNITRSCLKNPSLTKIDGVDPQWFITKLEDTHLIDYKAYKPTKPRNTKKRKIRAKN